jgi:hypothetical protein
MRMRLGLSGTVLLLPPAAQGGAGGREAPGRKAYARYAAEAVSPAAFK